MEVIYLVVPNQNLVSHLATIAPFVNFTDNKAEIPTADQTMFQDYMCGMGYNEGEDFQFESAGQGPENGYNDQRDQSGDGRYGGNFFPSAQTGTAQDNNKMGPSAATHGNNPMHNLEETEKSREEVLKDHIRYHRENQRFLEKDSTSYKDHQAAINRYRIELQALAQDALVDEATKVADTCVTDIKNELRESYANFKKLSIAATLLEATEVLTQEELTTLFDIVKDSPDLSSTDISQLMRDVEWPRGQSALRLALIRMYGAMHGDIPDGYTAQPGWYDQIARSTIAFLNDRGYETSENIRAAERKALAQKSEKLSAKQRLEAAQAEFTEKYADAWRALPTKELKGLFSSAKERMLAQLALGKDVDTVIADALASGQQKFATDQKHRKQEQSSLAQHKQRWAPPKPARF